MTHSDIMFYLKRHPTSKKHTTTLPTPCGCYNNTHNAINNVIFKPLYPTNDNHTAYTLMGYKNVTRIERGNKNDVILNVVKNLRVSTSFHRHAD